MAKKVATTYQKAQTTTANPAQRVIMVYQGIEKNIKIAIEAMKKILKILLMVFFYYAHEDCCFKEG